MGKGKIILGEGRVLYINIPWHEDLGRVLDKYNKELAKNYDNEGMRKDRKVGKIPSDFVIKT